MKKQLHFIFVLLIVAVLSVVMVGCGGSTKNGESSPGKTEATNSATPATATATADAATTDKVDTSEPVTLKYYMIGDEQKDSKAVWAEINTKLKAAINTTIEPVIIPWADVDQKYPLIFASGEQFDMVWTGNWKDYANYAAKGGFMEITDDMINKYAPQMLKELPAAAFKQARVGGKLYMIPTAEKMTDNTAVIIRGDLKDKYNLSSINSQEDLEKYADAIAKNEKGIIPLSDIGPDNDMLVRIWLMDKNHWATFGSIPYLAYDFTLPNPTIFSIYDTPEYAAFEETVKSYKEKGYLSKSALTSKNARSEDFKAGRGGVAFGNLNDMVTMFQEVSKAHPEWKLELSNANWSGKISTSPSIVHGTAIHATSKHMDRVLMAVQLLSSDQELNRLVNYGIKDKNYSVTDDGAFNPLNTDYVGTNYSAWAFRGNYLLKPANASTAYDSVLKYQQDNSVTSPIVAFSPDNTNIKNEMAAVTDVVKTKTGVLTYGPSMDVTKAIANISASMKAAGSDKVIAETTAQVKKYLDDYNK